MMDIQALKSKLTSSGQSHLFKYYDELEEHDKQVLLKDLDKIDVEEMNHLFEQAISSMKAEVEKLDDRMKPIPTSKLASEKTCSEDQLSAYYECGLKEISDGHVGVLLMAGGQGTRLGVTYPKGMYSVGLLSGKSLFQIQAERIRRVQDLAKALTNKKGYITWYIMTSGPTINPTKTFLKENNYFGVEPENVVIFQQGLLPCFDFDGKIFLEEKNKIALAPDGNGGIYKALDKCGILDDMKKRGILYVHAHSVDNILVKVADPIFLGYCVSRNADCGAKVVCKSSPSEAVGVVCLVDEFFQVVEYSEITDKTSNLKDQDGNLIFNAGNICNHFFSRQFLTEVAEKHESKLKLHVAKKKIPHINDVGEKIKPSIPNGIKVEKFIFDVFQFSKNFVTWEIPREVEFSALKNSDEAGKDCPSSARNDLFRLHKQYVEKAGAVFHGTDIEISPLLSYGGEDLEPILKDKVMYSPVHLKSDEELQEL